MEAVVHGSVVRSAGKRAGAFMKIGSRGTQPEVVQPPYRSPTFAGQSHYSDLAIETALHSHASSSLDAADVECGVGPCLEWNLNGTTDPRDGSVDHLSLNSLKDRHGLIRAPKSRRVGSWLSSEVRNKVNCTQRCEGARHQYILHYCSAAVETSGFHFSLAYKNAHAIARLKHATAFNECGWRRATPPAPAHGLWAHSGGSPQLAKFRV